MGIYLTRARHSLLLQPYSLITLTVVLVIEILFRKGLILLLLALHSRVHSASRIVAYCAEFRTSDSSILALDLV